VDGGLGDDVGVQAVAEIDGVDVVTGAKLACADQGTGRIAWIATPWHCMPGVGSPFQIAVHDSKEDL